MYSRNITIRNNKALKMLSCMEELELITINDEDSDDNRWKNLLNKIRENGKEKKVSFAEITKEVEIVRAAIHEKSRK